MEFHQQRLYTLNKLYSENAPTIDSMEAALVREIPLLIQEFELSAKAAAMVEDYVKDRATLFRFLAKNKFSLPHALSFLLDTIRWRIKENVDSIGLDSVKLFVSQPFCFFHKYDKTGRPILIIQIRHLPESSTNIAEFLRPFVIFILETTRRMLSKITRDTGGLVDIAVIVDFKDARSLPMDPTLVKTILQILRRYPSMTGSVSLLCFGWMYTGLWQMVKIMLSDEARHRVGFPSSKELLDLVDPASLCKDQGGTDDYEWNIKSDKVFRDFFPYVPPSPPLSPLSPSQPNSRCSSTTSLRSVYYDATEHVVPHKLQFTPMSPKLPQRRSSFTATVYSTPVGSLTPIVGPILSKSPAISPHADFSSSLNHKLSLLQYTRQPQPSPQPRRRRPLSINQRTWTTFIFRLLFGSLQRTQAGIRMVITQAVRKSQKYQNMFYWIAACLLLRNSIHDFLQSLFVLLLETMAAKSGRGSAIGLRNLLSLAGGHAGQMTL
ncbi:CRAL-TRIO domain-containing protein [Phycomyces blakesleeanus]|uniref:CRAL-TRIO domain-containing protein n=2 Tax=Phycomyces blakesleeanus TaxID=4837 RepID=A0A162TB87_PHYB8|nr:hypothetical protein PHYBLDRAFT_80358 [Phycomyces blakesleeanus NRRL 1555(-)]OAD65683.1 hypothetical protein PHYBLDRAFT_80358 [Phycomyces blakesleeanus NRRL 1555(-)]|eukprot:XP_018283723.1 hypothetical protein PHYBLDRAFT_80358 [Phycomyces blakesleeanus NRRL 1555(-)]